MRSRTLEGPPPADFKRLVEGNLGRYLKQNNLPSPGPSELETIAFRLWTIICERGLPPPLAPGEKGSPGELPESDTASAVARLMEGVAGDAKEALATPARQLVKACFNPEFTDCRNSFQEASPDGKCRRQELARSVKRLSGAHCVDCPYWTELEPEEHRKFLEEAWQPEGRAEFAAHRDIFLPEDFRGLRRWLREQASK